MALNDNWTGKGAGQILGKIFHFPVSTISAAEIEQEDLHKCMLGGSVDFYCTL